MMSDQSRIFNNMRLYVVEVAYAKFHGDEVGELEREMRT